MVEPDMVKVLGKSTFHDTALTISRFLSGDLCHLGLDYFVKLSFGFSFDFGNFM
ncbi:ABC transporter I family member 20, partial [Olea europaea subsp. europaea]